MKQELYNKIAQVLKEQCGIAHVDLWNQNIEFLEQEANWARPAVFVEFEPVKWRALVTGVEYRAEPRVRLHVITDWTPDESGIDAAGSFELPELIHEKLAGLSGEKFAELDRVESHTNHNHEDIMESIEVYDCVGYKHIERKQ